MLLLVNPSVNGNMVNGIIKPGSASPMPGEGEM
jgi:hypothetical protein